MHLGQERFKQVGLDLGDDVLDQAFADTIVTTRRNLSIELSTDLLASVLQHLGNGKARVRDDAGGLVREPDTDPGEAGPDQLAAFLGGQWAKR